MTGSGTDEVLRNSRAQLSAMVAGDTSALGDLLTQDFGLTHMSGYGQPKAEWLREIDAGQYDYQDAREVRADVVMGGDTAVLASDAVVRATVHGSHAAWRLHFTMGFIRRGDRWLAARAVVTTF